MCHRWRRRGRSSRGGPRRVCAWAHWARGTTCPLHPPTSCPAASCQAHCVLRSGCWCKSTQISKTAHMPERPSAAHSIPLPLCVCVCVCVCVCTRARVMVMTMHGTGVVRGTMSPTLYPSNTCLRSVLSLLAFKWSSSSPCPSDSDTDRGRNPKTGPAPATRPHGPSVHQHTLCRTRQLEGWT